MQSVPVGLVLVFVAIHVSMHLLALPLLRSCLPYRYAERVFDLQPSYMRVKLARLIRSSLYDAIALVCGAVLLCKCRNFHDLCYLYTPLHECAFCVALAHWIVSFAEDWKATARSFEVRLPLADTGRSGTQLQPHIIREANATATPTLIHLTCLVHHAVAAVAYGFILTTHLLGGMGAVGLLYEGPALMMNVREALVDFDPALGWLRPLGGDAALRCVHLALHALFLPCRTGGDCLYLYATFGPSYHDGIGTLPAYARAACHTLAGFFLCINFPGWWLLLWQSLSDTKCVDHQALDRRPSDEHKAGQVDDGVHELRPTSDAIPSLGGQCGRPPVLVRLTEG